MGFESFSSALKKRAFPLEFPGHYVGGEWIQDGKPDVLQGSFNPSRAEPIVKVLVSRKTVEKSVDLADSAQRELAALGFEKRLELLGKLRQVITDYRSDVIDALCIEAGKPRWEAEADFHSSLQQLDSLLAEKDQIRSALLGPASLANPETRFELQANGIAIAFIPFSTPLATFLQCFAGALIAGTPLLLMPSSHAVLTGALFAYMLHNLELPKGAFNIIFGNYQTFTKTLSDRRIQAVIYSGSREHCDAIRRDHSSPLGRQLLLQSGGKNAVIIEKTADIKQAVECVLYGVIKNAGQLNTSTSRCFIHESTVETFKKEMVRAVRALQIGPTDVDANPHLGPLYAQKAVDKFLRYQTMAKREAKETWVWGKVYDAGTAGHFVMPGVHYFENLESTSSYQTNVLMCPDLAVYRYKDIEQAIASCNQTDAALVTSLIGPEDVVQAWVSQLRSPNILINLPTVGLDVNPPLAGRKLCGDYRWNGLGIALLLTYPQSCRVADAERSRLPQWPQLD